MRASSHVEIIDLGDAAKCISYQVDPKARLRFDRNVLPIAAATSLSDVGAWGVDAIRRSLDDCVDATPDELLLLLDDAHGQPITWHRARHEDHSPIRSSSQPIAASGDPIHLEFERHDDMLPFVSLTGTFDGVKLR